MYVRTYVYMYVRMYVCTYVRMYVCMQDDSSLSARQNERWVQLLRVNYGKDNSVQCLNRVSIHSTLSTTEAGYSANTNVTVG
jgi:hypothetical protein